MGAKWKSVSNWSYLYRFYLGWERQPFHGGEHGNPLQYSCLENPKDRGVWQAHIDSTTFISNLFCFILFWKHHLPYLPSWKKWKKVLLVTQSCPALYNPMDCSPPGSSIHGILQARLLEWVAILFCRGSSQARNQTHISCIAGRLFTIWATREDFRDQAGGFNGDIWGPPILHSLNHWGWP